MVKEQMILMLKAPLKIVHEHLDDKLGEPSDICKVIENKDAFDFTKEFTVPSAAKKVEATPKPEPVKEQIPVKTASPVKQVERPPQKPIEDLASNNYMPIKALNTFMRDWIIKARVASDVKNIITKKGGKMMKIELVDQYGTQIEGTFFGEAADKFEHVLKKDGVYLFSNGQVKMANKKFTALKNDFCIIFQKWSQINEAKDDGSISNQVFDFTTIEDIQDIAEHRAIDVCGVIC